MDILKAFDELNPFLQPSEKAKVDEKLGKNPNKFDIFRKTYPVVTLERRKQEIDEMKDDIDRIKAEVSMAQYRTDMMARKSALEKADAHRREQEKCKTMITIPPEENQPWEHTMPMSLKDHLEAVAAPSPMALPDSEFELLTKEVDVERRLVIWRYKNDEVPYWAKELPKYQKQNAELSAPLSDKPPEVTPGGWVPVQYEGKTLYINHDLQQTSWYPFPVLPMKAVNKDDPPGPNAEPGAQPQVPQFGVTAAVEAKTTHLELDMSELENRLASYTHAVNWPHKFYEAPRLSTLAMAECGFYYVFDEQVHDRVRCAFCNVELSGFKLTDDPWVMHCIESPNCNFVKDGIPGINPATGQVAQGRSAVAKVRFEARHPDELSFQKGDAVTVLYDAPDENWYVAEVNGKKGVIPGTHITFTSESGNGKLEEVGAQMVLERMETRMDQVAPGAKKDLICTAIYDYNAKFGDELSFRAGQKMIVLPEPAEPGWYIGSLNGQKGLVPTTHVMVDDGKDSVAPGFFRKSDGAHVPVVIPRPYDAVDPQPATGGLYFPRGGDEMQPGQGQSHPGHRPTSFGLSQTPASLEGPASAGAVVPMTFSTTGSSLPVASTTGTMGRPGYPLDPHSQGPRYTPSAMHPNQQGSAKLAVDSASAKSKESAEAKDYTVGLVFNKAYSADPIILQAKQLMDQGWNLQDMPNYSAATIAKGDRLVSVDGMDTKGLPLAAVHRILRGEMNSLANLAFEGGAKSNNAGKQFQVTLRRHIRHTDNSLWEKTDEQVSGE